jgi:hypothetical protein
LSADAHRGCQRQKVDSGIRDIESDEAIGPAMCWRLIASRKFTPIAAAGVFRASVFLFLFLV